MLNKNVAGSLTYAGQNLVLQFLKFFKLYVLRIRRNLNGRPVYEHLTWQVTHHLSSWFISLFAALLECPFIYIFIYNYVWIHMYTWKDIDTHIPVATGI